MDSDQVQRQLEKYRRQEQFHKILIRSILITFGAAALIVGILVAINLLRRTPTLTPTELVNELSARDGQTVRLTGRVSWMDQSRLRLEDEKHISFLCQFPRPLDGIRENEHLTVQGTVEGFRLTNCRVIDD